MAQVTGGAQVMSAAAKLFDLRFMIDGLFGVYGVLLTIYSSFDSQAAIDKASGIHINLWLGLSMIVVALIFGAWAKLQPAKPPDAGEANDRRPPDHP